ncbi:hypothetical protein EFT80_18500 [Lactiplantibacillus pentosus]|nr:hypothetical protein [Lactiplantibacillus pentosus]
MFCPFCQQNTAAPIKLPNNEQILLQAVSSRGINIGQGPKVDLVACSNCQNIWMHSKDITRDPNS